MSHSSLFPIRLQRAQLFPGINEILTPGCWTGPLWFEPPAWPIQPSHLPLGHLAQQKHQLGALRHLFQDQELTSAGKHTRGFADSQGRRHPCFKACQSQQKGRQDTEVTWPACSHTLYRTNTSICSPNSQFNVAFPPSTPELGWLQLLLEMLLCSSSGE